MEFRIFSDLHNEERKRKGIGDFVIPRMEGDKDRILILAGDIDVQEKAREYAEWYSKQFRAVIFVPGNHEFWKGSLVETPRKLMSEYHNVHTLYNSCVVIDRVMFIGGTMWCNFNHNDPLLLLDAQARINDFKKIHYGPEGCPNLRLVLPNDIVKEYDRFVSYTTVMIREAWARGLIPIVVSHFAPLRSLTTRDTTRDALAGYFHADLGDLIHLHEPKMWIYGHTHENFDLTIYNTRIISNQHGQGTAFDNSPCPRFDPYKVVEL